MERRDGKLVRPAPVGNRKSKMRSKIKIRKRIRRKRKSKSRIVPRS
jgi:hypothetical protein